MSISKIKILKRAIQKKNNQNNLLKVILRSIKKLQEQKNTQQEEQILKNLEKEIR